MITVKDVCVQLSIPYSKELYDQCFKQVIEFERNRSNLNPFYSVLVNFLEKAYSGEELTQKISFLEELLSKNQVSLTLAIRGKVEDGLIEFEKQPSEVETINRSFFGLSQSADQSLNRSQLPMPRKRYVSFPFYTSPKGNSYSKEEFIEAVRKVYQ